MFSQNRLSKRQRAEAMLLQGIQYSDLPQIAQGMADGASPNLPDGFGNTGLHRFAGSCDLDGIILMVDAKANVNALNKQHEAPLTHAIRNGALRGPAAQMAAVKFLLAVKELVIPPDAVALAEATGNEELAAYLDRIQHHKEVRPTNAELLEEFGKGYGQPKQASKVKLSSERRLGGDASSCCR